jgi:hypothetical protein
MSLIPSFTFPFESLMLHLCFQDEKQSKTRLVKVMIHVAYQDLDVHPTIAELLT